MIEHQTKRLILPTKAAPASHNSEWGFPGSEQAATTAASPQPGTILTPDQRTIPGPKPIGEAADNKAAKTLADMRPDSEKDADYYDAALPSGFVFYDFKKLSVKKVTGRVQAKFSRAAAEKSIKSLTDAVSSLLGDGISAYDIGANDFKWLMHFILLLSYPSSPRKIVVECDAEAHIEKVETGELPESSLRYLHNFDRPILDETVFDPKTLSSLDLSCLADYELGIYTMRDAVAWEEKFSAVGEEPTDEETWVYNLAAYLKGGTFDERAEQVMEMSVKQFRTLEQYVEVVQKHGIYSYIKSTCKECGTENVTNVTISVRDFL